MSGGLFPRVAHTTRFYDLRRTWPVLMASLIALTTVDSALAAPLFAAPYHTYDVGSYPASVAIADFNGDGRSDLAVTNQESGSISILLGSGDGTFETLSPVAVGSSPTSVVVADLNEDGRADLAIACHTSPGLVAVLLGNGDGTFGTQTDVPVGDRLVSAAVADLNADGHQDLVIGGAVVSVVLGNGDGTFGDRHDVAGMTRVQSVAIADFNGDGRPDLAIANLKILESDDLPQVSIVLGLGDGTFGSPRGYLMSMDPAVAAVAVGDLDDDGRPDLAVAWYDEGEHDGVVSILLGNGDGTFTRTPDMRCGPVPHSVVIADFNADGRADVATANSSGDFDAYVPRVSILLGHGDGTFAPSIDARAGDRPWALAAGDLDRDGRLDLAVTNTGFQRGGVSVLLGNGDATFGTTRQMGPSAYLGKLTGADLNADGNADLVAATYFVSGVSVLLGNGDGTFAAGGDFGTGSAPSDIEVADVNKDGRLDIAASNYEASTVSILLGQGDGTFGPKADFAVGVGPRSLAIADLNADGWPDLAVATSNAGGTVSVLLGNGDGTFAHSVDVGPGNFASSVAIADLDSDGKPDLVLSHITHLSPTDENGVTILFGEGDGSFRHGPTFVTGGEPKAVFARDLSGDGRPDVVVAHNHYGIGLVSVWPGNGDGTFGDRADIELGGGGADGTAIADLDGDGRLDIATTGGDEWVGVVTVVLGSGDGAYTARTSYGCAGWARSPVVEDFDRDGRLDLVFVDRDVSPTLATVGIALMLGNRTGPTGPRLSLMNVEAVPDRVLLRWSGEGATALAASVHRRGPGPDWENLGSPVAEGAGILRYEDRSVIPGKRYSYRVSYQEGTRQVFTAETKVEVPVPLRLALDGLRPNPTAGAIVLSFSLPDASPGTLEVLDVNGRRVMSREVGSLGFGHHVVALDRDPPLAAGMYIVRLRHSGRSLVVRAAVIR